MEMKFSIQSLKTVYETIKTAIDARDFLKLIEIRTELYARILDVQESAFDLNQEKELLLKEKATLANEKSDLEREIQRLLDHRADIAENFVLQPTGNGGSIYRNKDTVYGHIGSTYLCANCVTAGQKSFLQPTRVHRLFKCPNGHGEIYV